MSDVFSWMYLADSSFRSCVKLLEDEELDNAAYLASQAGEKTLKALLVHLGIPFRKTHDMTWLASQLPAGHPLEMQAKSIGHITSWSMDHRYPADAGVPVAEPDAATIKGVLRTIEMLQTSVVELLPKPTSALVRGLLAVRPLGPGRRNEASVTVDASTLRECLSGRDVPTARVEAIRVLLPSARQRGYRWEGRELVKTGETHVEEWAAKALLEQLTTAPRPISAGLLTVDALNADEIANRRSDLSQAFDDLVSATASALKVPAQQTPGKPRDGREAP